MSGRQNDPEGGKRVLGKPELGRLVRVFRAFLGEENIRTARSRQANIRPANPFRHLLWREKQPWLVAMEEFDRLTLSGARLLPKNGVSSRIFRAAIAGGLYERLKHTLSDEQARAMRERLLDLNDRAASVVMEWAAADFYQRKGYKITWCGGSAPEFRASCGSTIFEVECKRISLRAREKMTDRDFLSLAQAVVLAAEARSFGGVVTLDVPNQPDVPSAEFFARVDEALPSKSGPVSIDIPALGRLTGHLQRWEDQPPPRVHDILAKMDLSPPDCRGVGASLPLGGEAEGDIVVFVRGPRRGIVEFLVEAVGAALDKAARQFSGDVPGVIVAEIQGLRDVTLFRDTDSFRALERNLFHSHSHVAGVVWRAHDEGHETSIGYELSRDAFAVHSGNCRFPTALDIPFVNEDK